MSRTSLIPLALALLLGISAPVSAAPASSKAATPSGDALDQKRIHSDYNDGNFERVTSALEGYMSRNKTYSLEDSIFIAKHLAVVYSANPQTREKGKYYMYRLLSMLPSAKLIDMYVSDEIDRIFDKVREEFLTRQKGFGVDSSQISLPEKSNSAPKLAQQGPTDGRPAQKPAQTQATSEPAVRANQGSRDSHKTAYFVAGGAAIVALGVTSYIMLGDSPKKTEKTYDIP